MTKPINTLAVQISETFGASVTLNGETVDGVKGISFDAKAGLVTTFRLELMGEVLINGKFEDKAIAQIRRDDFHPFSMTHRVKSAFRKIFPTTPDEYVDALTENVMRDLGGA